MTVGFGSGLHGVFWPFLAFALITLLLTSVKDAGSEIDDQVNLVVYFLMRIPLFYSAIAFIQDLVALIA